MQTGPGLLLLWLMGMPICLLQFLVVAALAAVWNALANGLFVVYTSQKCIRKIASSLLRIGTKN